ncbi:MULTISPECIES: hypothetical protein [unclassified Stenotrophomonas]|uniref:hypothetical protein n=1 Tax=unclassified Stenotrophomonas TaxID=196198 RepID=UPI00244853E0|nr:MULTISPECIES: hypothetical protein [unclassified Stenotrophomonas]MBN5158489.1 hypothetical protein [Stenotrophomonas maltophilia]MDG9842888.1 hypothetical protein [Stenotrophomonas sp. GD04054]MDH0015934.1 hypothetical protein [Stenotrophomonas sp. GD04028]MDH0576381.1 hypothetical protein [Stenotrophomonas sp. GD03997]MDH0859647.1 hypothetical protein [Stenotrophomonas sp. GD03882]
MEISNGEELRFLPSQVVAGKGDFLQWAVLFHLWTTACAGLLKYLGFLVGLPYFHLASKILLLSVALVPLALFRLRTGQLAIVSVIFLCLASSLLLNGIAQVMMGFWVLLPFFFGMIFYQSVLSHWMLRKIRILLGAAITFQLINYFIVFPWEGLTIEIGGISSLVGREWSDGGVRRLAGLSSSSIESSLLIAVLGLLVASTERRSLMRVLIVLFVFISIYLSTMKTAALAFAISSIPILLNRRVVRRALGSFIVAGLIVGLLLPFYMYSKGAAIPGGGGYASLHDRFTVVWPAVIQYGIANSGMLFGLGVGGLGASMQLGGGGFAYAFVDNLYLYMIFVGGIYGVALIAMIFTAVLKLTLASRELFLACGGTVLFFMVIYGITQVPAESSVAAIFLGAAIMRPLAGNRAHAIRVRI